MPTQLENLLEAEQRGILPPDRLNALTEARKRGLVPSLEAPVEPSAPAPTGAAGRVPTPGPVTRPSPVSRTAGVVGGGFNRGLATLAGLPVDIANRLPQLINLLPGEQGVGPISERPVGGAASIQQGIEGLGLGGVAREDLRGPGEKILGRLTEELGASALPIAGLANRARRGIEAASPIGRMLDEAFVRPFQVAPGKTAATEAALAAGAGGGAGLANQLAEGAGIEPSAVTDILGALAGSVTTGGALTAGRGAAQLGLQAGEIAGKVTGLGTPDTSSVRGAVGQTLAESATDPRNLPARIAEGQALASDIPGLQPTAAIAANDPGLQALEVIRQSTGPRTAGEFRQRATETNQALTRALADVTPSAADDAATRQALTSRVERLETALEESTARRQTAVGEAQARVEPPQTAQEAGAAIRGEVEAERAGLIQAREEFTSPSLKAALASKEKVDAQPVVDLIDAKLKTDKREAVVSALTNARKKLFKAELDPEGEAVLDDSVAGLFETRKAINDLIAGRGETSTGRFAQKELKEVRDALDAQIAAVDENFGQFIEGFREKSRPINLLEEGRTGRVLERAKLTGTVALPESEVAREFFTGGKGSPEAIQEFVRKVGDRAQAVEGLRSAALVDAKKAFDQGGEKALKKWLTKHEDALQRFPETRRDLSTLADVQSALARAQRREKLVKEGLTNPRKSVIAQYLSTEEARASMGGILGSRNPQQQMTKLMQLIRGDKDAVEGAKKAFFDFLDGSIKGTAEDLAETPLLRPGAFKRELRKHNPALEVLFKDDPAQLARVRQLADAAQRGTAIAKAKPPGTSGTPLGLSQQAARPLFTSSALAARIFAVKRGVVSPGFIVVEAALRGGRKAVVTIKGKEFDSLLDRALLDPEVAKTLVMEFNENTAKVVGRRMRLHLGREVSEVVQTDPRSDQSE